MQGFPANDTFDDSKLARPRKTWLAWVNRVQALLVAAQNYGNSAYVVVITGFTYFVPSTIEIVTFGPAGGLSAGTVTLPALPFSGQRVIINSTQAITTLTINASTGNSISTHFAATLAANTSVIYYYNQAQNTWYRIA